MNHMLKSVAKYSFKDKDANLKGYNAYTFARTISMFEWENLPETIPYKQLELMLQSGGYAFITKHNGKLYAFHGGLGGELDVYGQPTEIIISNTALNLNKTFKLTEGVLIHNDDLDLGLLPLITRYNTFLVENDINLMLHGYNGRTQRLISASNDRTKESADAYLQKIVDGELTVIGESAIFEGLKLLGGSDSGSTPITSLIEFQQYIKASLYNDLGLSDNYNMKRERLTQGETEAGEDSNFTFVYSMYKNRLKAVEELNEFFDLDIDVCFGSVWAKGEKQVIDDVVEESELIEVDLNGDSGITPEPEPEPELEPELEPEPEPILNDDQIDNDVDLIDNDDSLNTDKLED